MTPSSELASAQRVWRADGPLDLIGTLRPLQRGGSDPSQRIVGATVWRTVAAPTGPATVALTAQRGAVNATVWGEGGEWVLDALPDLLGARDRPQDFAPSHPVLAAARRCHPGVRLCRTGLIFDQVVPAVLEQKVTGTESRRSWRELLLRFGSTPPGPAPAGMRVAPRPEGWLEVADWEWHRAGVDQPRRRAIRAAASVAARLEECVAMSPADALRRLQVVPGIGQWTAAEVAQRSLGDADAVSVGDYNIPTLVGWALLGRRLDDAGMLALLEEYRPHRHRVVRLVELSGISPPRHHHRMAIRDYRRM